MGGERRVLGGGWRMVAITYLGEELKAFGGVRVLEESSRARKPRIRNRNHDRARVLELESEAVV